ncbi:MAG: ABC transporter ATP-binding protein [Micrococcaceae bacterium]
MLFKLVIEQFSKYKKYIFIVLILQFIQSMASLYLPTLNADIIDKGVIPNDTKYILNTGGFMLLVSLVQIVATITAVYLSTKISMGSGRSFRSRLFSKVQTFSSLEVGKFGTPSLITRGTNDVQQVQMFIQMLLLMMISAPITAIGGVVLALNQDVGLSWILAVTIPVLIIAVAIIMKFMSPLFRKAQGQIDYVNKVLREQIMGIDVIRAFVRKDFEVKRFDKANTSLTKTQTKSTRIMGAMFPIITVIVNAAMVAVIYFGGHQIESGGMEIGALTAYISYIMQIMMSVMMSMFVFFMMPRASVCANRIGEVYETETTIAEPKAEIARVLGKKDVTVEFDNVSFSYPGAESAVLTDINFDAKPGEIVAIIGSTGSGKSTLLNMVNRFFDVTKGEVKISGYDVKEYKLHSLRTHIGLVPQKAFLFKGTIASNLRYGNPEATDDELWNALEVAQAADFVKESSGELEAEVAQGGENFSGGQKQRLAIARALVSKPPIYLFDDSFSALDVATDAKLRAALTPVTKESVMIIVAQRVSTIVNADKILVLDQGKVVDTGTHKELLEKSNTYQEIVFSQMSEEEAGVA